MEVRLQLDILAQPDDTTCGPTTLHAVYRYFGDFIPLDQVIREVPSLETGGTLAVLLACHALRRGYQACIYTYNLQLFDPTWFTRPNVDITEKLTQQMAVKADRKLKVAARAYQEFLRLGGTLKFQDLNGALVRKHLQEGTPILAGLSATYLYGSARECGPRMDFDDIRGEPSGHFVVLCGYDRAHKQVLVADPLLPNPVAPTNQYAVSMDRLLCSILLGILTFDDNLLVINPGAGKLNPKLAPRT